MKKFTMLFVLALFLKIAVGQVTVNITVMNNLSPATAVSGASVTLTGATTPTVISDANGLATFSVPTPAVAVYYSVTITAVGYLDYLNTYLVYIKPTDLALNKTATIKKAFDITYKITDKNSVAISGASVKVNTTPATTLTTNATGDVTFSGLYSVANHSTLVSAAGYADSTFNVNVTGSSPNPVIVPAVELRNAYNIIFTVNDGTNPVAGANVTIGTTTMVTDASGIATFPKKVNGAYNYSITKTGFIDKNGSVTIADADQNPTISLAAGYDLTFTIINGATGTTGLQKDTITIDGISKITGTTGILTFGVAAGSSYSFDNKKAGFITVPVTVTNVMANTAITINMVPVYSFKFTVTDSYSNSKIPGAKVTLNGTDMITDATGVAMFTNVAPSATALPYTITGPDGSTYINQTGTIQAPLTSTSYTSNNNNISKSIYLDRPYVFISLTSGMMSYFSAATITFNGVDYPYDAGLGGNSFFVDPGTYSYTITPADITKAIITGSVTLTSTAAQILYINVVNGQKIEMYVTDATPDQNTIDGASVTLDGATQTTVGGYVVFERKAINTNYSYTIAKEGYGTVTGTAAMVTADLVITTILEIAHNVTFNVHDNSSTSWPPAGLEGATVTFNGNTAVTDVNGLATLPDEPNGSYDYTVTKEGFVTYKGTAYIEDADVMVEVYMKLAYSVQFTVTDGTNPVPNASIRLVSSWPVFDQTFMTDAQGVLLTDKLFPKWTSLDYTISADGFADAMGTVNIQQENLVVDPIALERAYEIIFTVNDGTNPVMGASVSINNASLTTDASGIIVFPKMINGDYSYVISAPGFVDNTGPVTVADAAVNKTITLTGGYDLTIQVINGSTGTIGLANTSITINGVTKITDADGMVTFGVPANYAVNTTIIKAGFADASLVIADVNTNMTSTVYMTPVYTVKIRVVDNNSYNPIEGATVVFNGETKLSDVDGYAIYLNVAPSATAYAYTVTGTGSYNSVDGTVELPFSSPADYIAAANIVSVNAGLTSPSVFISLTNGMMSYFGAATINFDGVDYAYDGGLGGNLFNCALGTHTYVITPADVTKAILRGSVVLTELEPSAYVSVNVVDGRKVEIFVVDKNTEPVEGAEVMLNGLTLTTDASGGTSFVRTVPGDYTYTVSKAGYISQTNPISVNTADVLEVVTLLMPEYTLTFNISDGTSAIANAIVSVGMDNVFTGADGKAVFTDMIPAAYDYMVTADGYDTIFSSVSVIDADIAENVTMKRTVYSLTFTITDGSAVVENASVTVGTTTIVTGADGKAVFTDLLPGVYAYTVTASGFAPATGSATITNVNAEKNVVLLSDVGLRPSRNGSLSAYPNPTRGNLKINLPDNGGKGLTISVTNIIGQVVIENKVVNSSTGFNLDLSGFDNGIYFINVRGNGLDSTTKVVKN